MKTVSKDEIFPIILIIMFPGFKLDPLLRKYFLRMFLSVVYLYQRALYPFLYEVFNFLMAMANQEET